MIEFDWLFALQIFAMGIAVGIFASLFMDGDFSAMSLQYRERLKYLGFWELVRLQNAIDEEFEEREKQRKLLREAEGES